MSPTTTQEKFWGLTDTEVRYILLAFVTASPPVSVNKNELVKALGIQKESAPRTVNRGVQKISQALALGSALPNTKDGSKIAKPKKTKKATPKKQRVADIEAETEPEEIVQLDSEGSPSPICEGIDNASEDETRQNV